MRDVVRATRRPDANGGENVDDRGRRRILTASVMALMPMLGAHAGEVLDQESPISGSLNGDTSLSHWQQEVTVGLAGLVSRVEVYVVTPGSANFYLNTGFGWQEPEHNFAVRVQAARTGWTSVDVSSAGIRLNAGATFVIGISGINQGLWFSGGRGSRYDGGDLYLNREVYLGRGEADMAFRTYMVPGAGCDGREKLRATCEGNVVKARLRRGSADNHYTLCVRGYACREVNANEHGRARAKFRRIEPGAAEVTVEECGMARRSRCR